jgi:hypothetical protein
MNFVQTPQTEHYFISGWCRTTAQAGVSALRHDGDSGRCASGNRSRYLGSASRQGNADGSASVTAAPISAEGRDVVVCGEYMTITNQLP